MHPRDSDTISRAAENAVTALRDGGPMTPWETLGSTGLPADRLRGDLSAGFDRTNVWIAVGLSELAVDVLAALQEQIEVVDAPTGGLGLAAWLTGGDALSTMPWAKRPPRCGYKEPHFAAVFLGLKPKART